MANVIRVVINELCGSTGIESPMRLVVSSPESVHVIPFIPFYTVIPPIFFSLIGCYAKIES